MNASICDRSYAAEIINRIAGASHMSSIDAAREYCKIIQEECGRLGIDVIVTEGRSQGRPPEGFWVRALGEFGSSGILSIGRGTNHLGERTTYKTVKLIALLVALPDGATDHTEKALRAKI